MFINNGDGTYTVRFYYNGTADYVTVNSSLPNYYGTLIYADYGTTLLHDQLALDPAGRKGLRPVERDRQGRPQRHEYLRGHRRRLDGRRRRPGAWGTMPPPTTSSLTEQTMINALAADEAVTIGTDGSSNSGDTLPGGLYGSHAYAVTRLQCRRLCYPLQPLGLRQPGI